jgi:hypothetical protein
VRSGNGGIRRKVAYVVELSEVAGAISVSGRRVPVAFRRAWLCGKCAAARHDVAGQNSRYAARVFQRQKN